MAPRQPERFVFQSPLSSDVRQLLAESHGILQAGQPSHGELCSLRLRKLLQAEWTAETGGSIQ